MNSLISKIISSATKRYDLRFIPDKIYLELVYQAAVGNKLDLNNPKSFGEKLQWIKLYDRRPEYTMMVDKYAVRDHIKNTIGEKYLIPLIGVWDRFDDIDFSMIPEKFVIKCNHDSHSVIICKDKNKFDKKAAKKKLEKALNRNYFYEGRQWPYKNVKPRIIVEEYMEDCEGKLDDFKIYNFNGEPKVIQICADRNSGSEMTVDYYSEGWEHYNARRPGYPNASTLAHRPDVLDELLSISRKLSKDIPYLRTDFYIIDNRIYFGELTFFPGSGFKTYDPYAFDLMMGSWIKLPQKRKIK